MVPTTLKPLMVLVKYSPKCLYYCNLIIAILLLLLLLLVVIVDYIIRIYVLNNMYYYYYLFCFVFTLVYFPSWLSWALSAASGSWSSSLCSGCALLPFTFRQSPSYKVRIGARARLCQPSGRQARMKKVVLFMCFCLNPLEGNRDELFRMENYLAWLCFFWQKICL